MNKYIDEDEYWPFRFIMEDDRKGYYEAEFTSEELVDYKEVMDRFLAWQVKLGKLMGEE